ADENKKNLGYPPALLIFAKKWFPFEKKKKKEKNKDFFPAAPEVMTSYSFPGLVAQNGSKKRAAFPWRFNSRSFSTGWKILAAKRCKSVWRGANAEWAKYLASAMLATP